MSLALVVDDSMLIRHIVCRYLEQRGWQVETAIDGAEAVHMLASLRPDLIVTDMAMPRMSGSEFITLLKQTPATAEIPVIVLCGRTSEPEAKAVEHHTNGAVYKDINILQELESALRTATPPIAQLTVGG